MIKSVVEIAKQAGQEILQLYESQEVEVSQKKDASPITQADLRSHRVVVEGLSRLFPNIPVLSEESPAEVFEKRRSWEKFWLVDPLDGTKDFIARTDQFTVNIALIEDNVPQLGVIYIPVSGKAYWAERFRGSFRDGVRISNERQNQSDFIAADSHFHSSVKMQEFFRLNLIDKVKPIGSSIKF
jgi:3'(2'), 5'-bisphosphate nucleotidase